MRGLSKKIAVLSLFIVMCVFSVTAQRVSLRVAANVPPNSPWDLGLQKLSADFERVSGGRVRISFPQSLRNSSETDMLQKMRLGVDGALLTTVGFSQLYPDILLLSMPSIIRNNEEFDAVFASILPIAKRALADRYVILTSDCAGWIRCFSKNPIVYPADLERIKISVDPADMKVSRLLQSVGAYTVRGDTSGTLLQINAGTVDSVFWSPVFVTSIWSQISGKLTYMSAPLSPFIGAMIFNKSSWEKVPADIRPQLEKLLYDTGRSISVDSARLEANSVAVLLREGIRSPAVPPDAAKKWAELYVGNRRSVITEMFSPAAITAVEEALARVRGGK